MINSPVASRFVRWVPALCVLAFLLPGCAIMAPATAWQPAQVDIGGMQRLSVLQFSGDQGEAVTAALTTRLWENEFYALVDPSNLAPVRVASATNVDNTVQPADYLDSARGQGIDGLIVGDVLEYRCDDQVLSSTQIHVATGQSADHLGGQHAGTDLGVSQNQTIHREATVSIAFRLVEVETGKVRATRKAMQTFQGDFGPHSGPLPARGEVLDDLTQQCIEEFITMLAPHEVKLDFELARGHWFQRGQALVSKGNDFARRGRWEEAMTAWQKSLEINPTNDAALYNLGMAHASRSEFTQAEEFAIKAMNLKHKELYADGLEQIRTLATDHEQTLRQRQQARLLPAASGGQALTLVR